MPNHIVEEKHALKKAVATRISKDEPPSPEPKSSGERSQMMLDDKSQTTEVCEACGEPATRHDREGIPLCEDDYQYLLKHWPMEDSYE